MASRRNHMARQLHFFFISMMGSFILMLLLQSHFLAASSNDDDARNFSSIDWATAMDSEYLQSQYELSTEVGHRGTSGGEEDFRVLSVDNDSDAGFSSLDSMLQWAIGHSDPATLKGTAEAVQELTESELEERQAAIKELMESLRMPSDADLMKIAIEDLQNSSSSVEYRLRALHELLELVEPIDNANDLHKLGGLAVVIEELSRPEEDLRIMAAWILGKATQNNAVVQDQLLQHGVLPKLMEMARAGSTEEAVKALYALSGIIRNNPGGQENFYSHGGALLLEDLMKNSSSDVRLRRKSLFLVADLAEQQRDVGGTLLKFKPTKGYLMSVVNLVVAEDLDTQEKALMAIRSLSESSRTMHNMLRHDCDVESVLSKLELQLNDLMQSKDQTDFARDLQSLCRTVRSMFSDERNGQALA